MNILSKNKIYFFNRKINFIINHLYILILVIGVLCCVIFFDDFKKIIAGFVGLDEFYLNLIVLAIDIVINTILLFLGKGIKKLFTLNVFIKHKIFPFVRRKIIKVKNRYFRFIGNKKINIHYFTNINPTPLQKSTNETLFNSFNSENNKKITPYKIFWIQGDAFSGKSIIISNFLIEIISMNRYYDLFKIYNDKIIYIDLIVGSVEEFIENYSSLKYQENIVIIDNTYLLSDSMLLSLCNTLSSTQSAKLVVVLLRGFHENYNNSFVIEKLKELLYKTGKMIELPLIKLDSLTYEKDKLDSLFNLTPSCKLNDFTEIHYLNLLNRKQFHSQLLLEINDFLKGNISMDNFTHKVIIIISTLCLFTGEFAPKQLFDIFTKKKMLVKKSLSELLSIGFVNRSPYKFGGTYTFNSKVAEDYFKIGYNSGLCSQEILNTIKKQYSLYKNKNNYLAFLYGYFLDDKLNEQKNLFDSIAINLNFNELLNRLNFLTLIESKKKQNYKRELGILYDRTGNFKKSRNYLRSLLSDAISKGDMDLAAESYYRLVQIDHCEYNNYERIRNYSSKQIYLILQKEYWSLHIEMHKGHFMLEKFIKLLIDSKEICNEKILYDNLHLLRRTYFDAYRLYYLDGSMNGQELIKIKTKSKKIETFLRNNLIEFDLYYKKFSVLFLLSKEILFNLKLDETIIDRNVYDCFLKDVEIETELVYNDMSNPNKIVDKSIKICSELEQEFEKVGDKTFNFIRYYRTELLITQFDPSCATLIRQYRDFGIDEIEYRLYAEFLQLKYLISKLIKNIEIEEDEKYLQIKNQVEEQLGLIRRFINSSNYDNAYAIMRYKIYDLLLKIQNNEDIGIRQSNLKKAIEFSKINNYKREGKILEIIDKKDTKVSPGWCRDILLYYPIVPQ